MKALRIRNPMEPNDWEISKFFEFVLFAQISIWSLIAVDAIGLHVPVLQQVIGFLYVTFVPGVLLLRVLRLHKLGNIETFAYSCCLSLAFVMLIGVVTNFLYPRFGISDPLSLAPVTITVTAAVMVLCVVAFFRDKEFSHPAFIDLNRILNPSTLLLVLLPFLAVFGTYLTNYYYANSLLLITIALAASAILYLGFNAKIPEYVYPLAIFTISLTLLLNNSLISNFIVGWADLPAEYSLANAVLVAGVWDPSIPIVQNGALGVVMIAPIYSTILNLDLVWVFKVVYPVLWSFVPLFLYRIVQTQIGHKNSGDKIAFLSGIFFASFYFFYTTMLGVNRQIIADLFVTVFILVLIDRKLRNSAAQGFLIIFAVSIAVSHYLTAFVLLVPILLMYVLPALASTPHLQRFYNYLPTFAADKLHFANSLGSGLRKTQTRTVSLAFVSLFVIVTLIWASSVAGSSSFYDFASTIGNIGSNFISEFFSPQNNEGAALLLHAPTTMVDTIYKGINLASQLLTVVGFFAVLFWWKKARFTTPYLILSASFVGLLAGCVVIPYFANAIATLRFIEYSLLVLSPFAVIGGIWLSERAIHLFKGWTKIRKPQDSERASVKLVSIFFVIYLLFNVGFVHQVFNEPTSFAFNYSPNYSIQSDTPNWSKQEITAVQWLGGKQTGNVDTWADAKNSYLIQALLMEFNPLALYPNNQSGTLGYVIKSDTTGYLFLGRDNIQNDTMRVIVGSNQLGYDKEIISKEDPILSNIFYDSNRICDTGQGQIYYR
jgi:uncharacterized membrane protein